MQNEDRFEELLEQIETAFFEHDYEQFVECLVLLARFV